MNTPLPLDKPVLLFYRINDAFGEFSNFSPHPIVLDGVEWPTSEHYFQAQKFHDHEYRERIRMAIKPMAAAQLGRSRTCPIRTDWEAVKDDVMRLAVRVKFTTYPSLMSLLLSTDNRLLVEQTTDDHYWGCGTSGEGKNMLGVILMEIRSEFRQPHD